MADETPPPKRMGRPPKHPDQGKRPNLSLRVRPELYEEIVKAAAASGRSLSEEMEYRVTEAFYMSQPAKVKEAVDAALWEKSEENVEQFGGRVGYAWHVLQNHFFLEAMADAYDHFGFSDPSQITPEFIDYVFAKMNDAQPRVKKLWQVRILAARAATDPEFKTEFQRLWDADPELRQSILEKLGRK